MAQLDRESSNLHHGERLSSEETLPRFDAVSRGEGGAEDQFRGAPSVSVTESLVLPPAQPPVGKDSVRTVSRNAAARGASPLRQLTSRLWGSECYFARPRDGTHQFRAVHVHPSGVLHFSVVDRTGSRCAPQEVPISCGCALFGIARLRGCSVAMSSLVRRLRSEGEAPEKAPAAGLDLAFDDSDEEDESVGTGAFAPAGTRPAPTAWAAVPVWGRGTRGMGATGPRRSKPVIRAQRIRFPCAPAPARSRHGGGDRPGCGAGLRSAVRRPRRRRLHAAPRQQRPSRYAKDAHPYSPAPPRRAAPRARRRAALALCCGLRGAGGTHGRGR